MTKLLPRLSECDTGDHITVENRTRYCSSSDRFDNGERFVETFNGHAVVQVVVIDGVKYWKVINRCHVG